MSCEDFWKTMPELASCGSGLEHLRECGACAALWKRQLSLSAGLRNVADDWRRLDAPARVEARLVAAYRTGGGAVRAPESAVPLPHFWFPAAAWAAAAVLLVAAAGFLVTQRQPLAARVSTARPVETAALQVLSDAVAADDPSYGEDFVPLPNAPRLSSNDDVNLVRVEVPRSSMMELGFAVSAERAADPVEAEVVLGPDGLARAVRFLDN